MKTLRPLPLVLLGLCLWATAPADEPPRKPNFIYFILDDLGYYELSHMGHPEMRTPNIDRLAAEGMRFTQCLAGGPVCAPTRCALMTGKHPGHMTVRANGGADALRGGEATIASVLKRAGYATGGFGKWGLGARGTSGLPEEHGFDLFFGYYDQVHAHTYYPRYLVRNSVEVPLAGNTGNTTNGQTFSQYVIFKEAMQFIRDNKSCPFFAYCAWTPPHGLWGIPRDDPSWQLYKDKPWSAGQRTKDDAKIYAAMINLVDRQIGEVRDLLKELGIADNTVIFFSGDNGGQDYFPSREHPRGLFAPNVNPKTGVSFRGGKGGLYEGGLRVPFIVHWPRRIPGGAVSDHLCWFPDVLPTIAELAGAESPEDIDGLSIVPELLGAKGAGRAQPHRQFLYWEHEGQIAVRKDNWKAVRNGGVAGKWELYDLARDLSETNNLAASQSAVLKEMKAFARTAHTPIQPGEVYDQALLAKDRDYLRKTAKE